MKIGFIGLGIMGRPMAGHLVAGGHQLFVHDIKPAPVELTSQGAVACASGKEAAGHADVVITMVDTGGEVVSQRIYAPIGRMISGIQDPSRYP